MRVQCIVPLYTAFLTQNEAQPCKAINGLDKHEQYFDSELKQLEIQNVKILSASMFKHTSMWIW